MKHTENIGENRSSEHRDELIWDYEKHLCHYYFENEVPRDIMKLNI